MLQALVNKGRILVENVPSPEVSDGCLLIKTVYSCISAGTELGSIQNSGTPLIKRALQQPENVKKVLMSIKNQGIANAYSKVKGELDSGKPTGYSLSGIVISIGDGVKGFSIGDHVTASGAGLANHAECVNIPVNLVAKMPKTLNFEKASTVTLGAIAMQGVRRADLRLGELAVIFGCGILGLLALQMLKIAGVRVAAVDLDEKRLALAKELGAELVVSPKTEKSITAINNWSGGKGADAVIFTAATSSNEPLSNSFQMCRKKGKVVLVGVSGMNIKREDIYKKELDFLISTSYGPGRYDVSYERKGIDYPYAYVRWTENRNMQEYLRLLDLNLINLDLLITNIFEIKKADEAFTSLKSLSNKPLIVLLNYGLPNLNNKEKNKYYLTNSKIKQKSNKLINYAVVGAGSFATNMHLPNLAKLKNKFNLIAICDHKGSNALNISKRFGAQYYSVNYDEICSDSNIDLVVITTRHENHAELVLKALRAGKHVLVEKPLAVNQEQLDLIKKFYNDKSGFKPVLLVGFNRRFSKYAKEIKKHAEKRINPLFIRYRMNAGFVSSDSWIHEHGGRIVGESCHIIDLMTYLTESKIKQINFESLEPNNDKFSSSDNKVITLKYEDGSVCTIDYFAVGNKSFPKEYMEVHFDEKTIVLEDYKKLTGYGIKIKQFDDKLSQKGQFEELVELQKCINGTNSNWPIELWDMIQTTEVTFKIVNHI